MLVSVVIPIYGAPKILPDLYERLVAALEDWTDFELVMVNDCCPKGSGPILDKLATNDSRVKAVHLARNYGQHVAITAGVDYATGDYIVVMDCDLQDQPEEIKKLYEHLIANDFEAVFGIREARKHSRWKRFESKIFGTVYRFLTQDITTIKEDVGNFSIITRKTADAYRLFRERDRLYGLIICRILPEIGITAVAHASRPEGKSSYNFFKRVKLATNTIVGNSVKPLSFAIYCAVLTFTIALVIGIKTFVSYMIDGATIPGWTSIILLICFFSGLQFLFLGIMGVYIGETATTIKQRPLYLVSKRVNISAPKNYKQYNLDHQSE